MSTRQRRRRHKRRVEAAKPAPQRPTGRRTSVAAATIALGLTSGTPLADAAPGDTTTAVVRNIVPGAGSSNPTHLTTARGAVPRDTLFFSASDTGAGRELWTSDGTAAGTVRVRNINPGVADSDPEDLTDVDGTLFFTATDPTRGRELWKSDGTVAGTVPVRDIVPGSSGSSPEDLTDVDGTLFFSARNGKGRELWKSNGTVAGTVLVRDINPGGSGSDPRDPIEAGGMVFFSARNASTGRELWKSNGTVAGTVSVRDIDPGGSSSYPEGFTDVGGTLFFSASYPNNPYTYGSNDELWKSDGTAAGTVQVRNINYGDYSGSPQNLTNVGGTLFFSAFDDEHPYYAAQNNELWKSDGTTAGTVKVRDISPTDSDPRYLTNVNGTLFFGAQDAYHVYYGTNNNELWKSDGTAAGTVEVRDINPGSLSTPYGPFYSSSSPSGLKNVNGTLFFGATDGASGRELWKSDGTATGTVQVADINPGAGDSLPQSLSNVHGMLFFTATDPTRGRELWRTTIEP